MNKEKKVYLAKVEKSGDDYVLLFEEGFFEGLGWEAGDILGFHEVENMIVIKKFETNEQKENN